MYKICNLYRAVGLVAFLICLPAVPQSAASSPLLPEWQPPVQGVVPNADTAVRIGTAVLDALGTEAKRELEKFKPWHAELAHGGAWEVRGTLLGPGGTYVVVIAKRDGRIIAIFHEQ